MGSYFGTKMCESEQKVKNRGSETKHQKVNTNLQLNEEQKNVYLVNYDKELIQQLIKGIFYEKYGEKIL